MKTTISSMSHRGWPQLRSAGRLFSRPSPTPTRVRSCRTALIRRFHTCSFHESNHDEIDTTNGQLDLPF
jgi:hypothetical protein